MTALNDRIQKSAEILGVPVEGLTKALEEEGIDDSTVGMTVLNATTTTIEDLTNILSNCGTFKSIKLKAAASILKEGCEAIKAETPIASMTSVTTAPDNLVEAMKAMRPLQQWSDKELLDNFIATRSAESETELDRRAKHNKFVVLKDPATRNMKKYEPGQEVIDIEMTLKLLRDSRKRTIPGILPIQEGFVIVHRITDLNVQDRIVEICPICDEILYQGYCEKCQLNFAEVGEDELAYVSLISKADTFRKDSFSDRKAVLRSAQKGIDDLKLTWPSLSCKFDELKILGELPKLKKSKSLPSSKLSDPFYVK